MTILQIVISAGFVLLASATMTALIIMSRNTGYRHGNSTKKGTTRMNVKPVPSVGLGPVAEQASLGVGWHNDFNRIVMHETLELKRIELSNVLAGQCSADPDMELEIWRGSS